MQGSETNSWCCKYSIFFDNISSFYVIPSDLPQGCNFVVDEPNASSLVFTRLRKKRQSRV